MYTPAIIFTQNNELEIVDQTLLPKELTYIKIKNLEDAIDAIKQLKVRGAPAIGILAAYTLYVLSDFYKNLPPNVYFEKMKYVSDNLSKSRPTAVNLVWAINRIQTIFTNKIENPVEITESIKKEAIKIHEEDILSCKQIGLNALKIVPRKCNIITHCNAGSLATGGWGTALGVIYAAHENGKDIHVYVDETRPLGQGARLTLWELDRASIPCTLITDSMSGSLMAAGKIDLVVFGADRIAVNGDVANKIGSYNLAVLANYHNVPCYSAAPLSTFDKNLRNGSEIPIEIRDPNEILRFYEYEQDKKEQLKVYNPAFDVTPAKLLTGIITEKGIFKEPYEKQILKELK